MRYARRRASISGMASFAVERYLPGSTRGEQTAEIERVNALREHLSTLGAIHVRSLMVPADEMCMHFFEAEREADLIVAFRHTRLPYDRIVEVELPDLPA